MLFKNFIHRFCCMKAFYYWNVESINKVLHEAELLFLRCMKNVRVNSYFEILYL